MDNNIVLSDEIKLNYVNNVKITDTVFYKYNVISNEEIIKDIYLLSKISDNDSNIDKEKLLAYITEEINKKDSEYIVIDINDFIKTITSSEKNDNNNNNDNNKRKNKGASLNFVSYQKFDEAMLLINELNTKCNFENAFSDFDYSNIPKSYSSISNSLENTSMLINRLHDGGGVSKLISDYQESYNNIFKSILNAFASEQLFKAENKQLELSSDSLSVFGSSDGLCKDVFDYCSLVVSGITDGGSIPSSFGEYFTNIEKIYNKYDVVSQQEAEAILNAGNLKIDSEELKDMTDEEKENYIKNLNSQLDGIYDCLNESLGLSRSDFDNLIKNDIKTLAKLISDSSIESAKNRLNGGEDINYLNNFFFAMQDAYYSIPSGQEALLNRFLENSTTEFDEYNSLGYTDYIQYCMASGHAHDWLREDLRSFSNTINKINLNSNMSGLQDNLSKEELNYISEYLANTGYLPYGYVNENGTYKRRTYSKMGEEMLYYMDYHCGENIGNSLDNKVITAFSNQGKMDAVQRNYKGSWINERIKNATSESERKLLEEEALLDYQILNGLKNDKARKEELISQGYMSFEDLLSFVESMGDDVTNLASDDYINANKDKILELTGLNEDALYNFKVNTLNPILIRNSTLSVSAIELASGLVKFFENIGDAVDTAFHSDFILNVGKDFFSAIKNTDELSKEVLELRNKIWNEYASTDLYKSEFDKYLNSATSEADFTKYFYAHYDDGSRSAFINGHRYYNHYNIPDDVKLSVIMNIFQERKYQEWDLNDTSSSNYYKATFKEGIRNGGVFTTFDSLSENILENAQKQLETMDRVAVDKTGEWFYKNVFSQDWYNSLEINSLVKNSNILGMTVNQVGNMAIPVLSSMIPVVGQALSSTLLFVSSFGGASEEAFVSGASYNEALTYATLSATTELLIEKVFSGVAGFGEGWLDDALEFLPNKILSATNLVDNVPAQVLKKLIVGGFGEGIEEVTTDFVTPLWKSLTFLNEKSYSEIVSEDVSLESEIQTFLVSFLSSMVFGSSEIIQKNNMFNNQYSNLVEQIGYIPGMKDAANGILAEIIGYDTNVLTSDIISKLIDKTVIDLKQSLDVQSIEMLQKLITAKQELDTRNITFEMNDNQVTLPLGFAMDTLDMALLTKNYTIENDTIILKNNDIKSYAKTLYNIALNQLNEKQISNALNLEVLVDELNNKTYTKETFAIALKTLADNNIDTSIYSEIALNEENISIDEQVENIYKQAIEIIEKNGKQTKTDINTIKDSIKNNKYDAWDLVSLATDGNIKYNGVVIDTTGETIKTDSNIIENVDTSSVNVDTIGINTNTDTVVETSNINTDSNIIENADTSSVNVDTTGTNTNTDTVVETSNINTDSNIIENVDTSSVNAAIVGTAVIEGARANNQDSVTTNNINLTQETKADDLTKKSKTENAETSSNTETKNVKEMHSSVDNDIVVVTSLEDLINKYGDQTINSFNNYVFNLNSVYGLILNNDLEQLNLIKNIATDYLRFVSTDLRIYNPCNNVIQMIDFAIDGGLGGSVSNIIVNGNVAVDLNVAKEFINATNGKVSLQQIFNMVRDGNGDCTILFANDNVISTCETLLKIAENNNFNNQYIDTLRRTIDITKSNVDINEKYLLISKMRMDLVKPNYYDIFETSILKNGIDIAIKELEQTGISNKEVAENILYSSLINKTKETTREYYYKVFDYLTNNNMNVEEAVEYIRNKLYSYYDVIGSRVIYSDPSGLKIKVAFNFDQDNLDSIFFKIMEGINSARKNYGITDLNVITISDRLCPDDLYWEKVEYKDYSGNNRFVSSACANATSIFVWNGTIDMGDIIHEYGHTVDHYITKTFSLETKFSESIEWKNAIEADKAITLDPISGYSTASFGEDFAEFIRVCEKNPIATAIKYPNRFNTLSKYLSLNLEEKIINLISESSLNNVLGQIFNPDMRKIFIEQYVLGQSSAGSIEGFDVKYKSLINILDNIYKDKISFLKDIGPIDLYDMIRLDVSHMKTSYQQINEALNDLIRGNDVSNIFSENEQKLLKLFDKEALTDLYLFNRSYYEFVDYINGNTSFIYDSVIENLKKNISHIPEFFREKVDFISNLGDNQILNMVDYLNGISEPVILPRNIEGISRPIDFIYKWLQGTMTINDSMFLDCFSDFKAFSNYVVSNNIMLDETLMKKINVINNLNSNETILNPSEFLSGKDAIIASSFQVDGTSVNVNAILDILNQKNDIYLKILNNQVVDGLSKDNLFKAIDELYNIVPSLKAKTNTEYKVLIYSLNNDYALDGRFIVPIQFGNIDTILIESILSNPESILKFGGGKQIEIIEAIDNLIKYLNHSSSFIEDSFITEYNDKYKALQQFILSETTTINIKNGVYSEAYHVFKSLDVFGANQGVINEMLKNNGIKNTIQMLFDNVGKDTFLQDLRDMKITDGMMGDAIDKATDANQNFISNLINKVFSLNPDTQSINNLINFLNNNDVVDLVRKNYPGMSKIDAVRFMYLMETVEAGGKGICNYATIANMIFEYFMGNEELFEQSLGYPMYITLENGKRVLNDRMLLADMYSIINDGVLVKNVNGSYEIDVTNSQYIYLSNLGRVTMDAFDKFIKKKGLDINLKESFFFDSNNSLMYKEEILLEIKKSLENNQYITISAGGFNLYKLDGKIAYEDCGGHIMTILGINPEGKIIVDSWGIELLINLDELVDNIGTKYENNGSTSDRWFNVVSYEFTDTPTDINISPNSNTSIYEETLNAESTIKSQRELEEMYGAENIKLFKEIYRDPSKLYTYISTLNKTDVDLMRRIVNEYYNSSPNDTLEKLRKRLSSNEIDLRLKYNALNNTPYTFEMLNNIISSSDVYTYITDESFIEGSKILIEYYKEIGYDTEQIEQIVSVLDSNVSLEEKYARISQIHIEQITPVTYYEYQKLYNIHKNVSKVITILEERGYNSIDISSTLLHCALRNSDKEVSRSYYNKAFDYLVSKGSSKEIAANQVKSYYEYLLNERGVHTVLTTTSGIKIKIVNGFNCDNKLLNPKEIAKVLERSRKYYEGTDLKEIIIYDTFSPKNKYSEHVQYKNYSKNKTFISAASASNESIFLWSDFDDINTLVHEYAHTIDRHISRMYAYLNYFSNSLSWVNAIKEDKAFNGRIISRYATASNQEDFAEFLRAFDKDPINAAMAFPNRYKVALRYLNLEIDEKLIDEYISSSLIQYVIDDAVGILSKDGTPLSFIKDYLNNTPYNNFARKIFDELNMMYENKLEIFEDFTTYQVLESIKLESNIGTNEFLDIIKDYLDNKSIGNRISVDNKKILDLMNKDEIREWMIEEEFDITKEGEPIIIDEKEYQSSKTNESITSFFNKDNDIDRLKKILHEDISLLDQSDLKRVVDYINKGKIKIKNSNLSMDTIHTLLSNNVSLNKIYPLSNVKALKTFIDYFSLDTLTLFDKLNNGFLLMNNAENLYQLFDYHDLSIPKLDGNTKIDELYNLITNTINSSKISNLRSYTFNYRSLENTEYSKLHPELFLEDNAPSDLKELYYTGKINSSNEYNSEFSKYLEGKSIKGIIHKPLQEFNLSIVKDINISSSKSTKYLSGLEELSKKTGLSTEEIQHILSNKLQDLINNSEFVIRRSGNSLLQILQSGKFKNQFEVNNSTFGVYDPNMRMTFEEEIFNLPRNIRYEERPIYGMLLPKDLNSKYVLKGPGAFYSSNNGAMFVFDIDKIKQSTTLTLADSLDYASKINATNLTEPKYFGMMDELLSKINSKEDLYNFDFTHLYNKSSKEVGTSAYYEFQIHGNNSHSLDNLKKIVFLKTPNEEIIKELKKLNINWEVL